jgi:hypothetical protein
MFVLHGHGPMIDARAENRTYSDRSCAIWQRYKSTFIACAQAQSSEQESPGDNSGRFKHHASMADRQPSIN